MSILLGNSLGPPENLREVPHGLPQPNAFEFAMQHGRHPQLGKDEFPPWDYWGWMRLVVQLCDHHPQASGRWQYYFQTIEKGQVLQAPIPQLAFGHSGVKSDESPGHKAIRKWLDIIFAEEGSSAAFRILLDWFCWGLGLASEKPRISAKLNEKLYRDVNLEPLIVQPYDYWSEIYQDGKSTRWNNTGFYCTPHGLVKTMFLMLLGDRDDPTETVLDPCTGGGRFLLEASNYSLALYGVDIDPICVAMTKINSALYVPWLAWPFSEEILQRSRPDFSEYKGYRVDRRQQLLFSNDQEQAA